MDNKFKPALIGGLVGGVLSVIPFVNFANICCCLWAIVGGLIASYLYVKNSAAPATPGDGAVLGALAGVVTAVITIVIGIPVALVMGQTMRNLIVSLMENADPRQAEIMRRQFEASGDAIGPMIVQSLIFAVLFFVFSLIGGLLGVLIFEKRKGGAPPPPPLNI